MNKYMYDGPVMEFNICVAENWKGYTQAPSEKKARNNLAYQYKIHNNRAVSAKVTLPGKMKKL